MGHDGGITASRLAKLVLAGALQPEQLVGTRIKHVSRGWAVVEAIHAKPSAPEFILRFGDSGVRSIDVDDLLDRYWQSAILPSGISIEARNDVNYIKASMRYKFLRERFHVSAPSLSILPAGVDGDAWRLYSILDELDKSDDFIPSREDLRWLQDLGVAGVLASAYDRLFQFRGDAWDAARASHYWRVVGDLKKALASTQPVSRNPYAFAPDSAAAALTSRAAVFRSMRQVTEAERLLRLAWYLSGGNRHIQNTWSALP
ncbi:MAG TPA: hypothetical protein PKD55_26855 [Bellilinea sp.]|nr:hypothetical protein [Bellilinea sp.]